MTAPESGFGHEHQISPEEIYKSCWLQLDRQVRLGRLPVWASSTSMDSVLLEAIPRHAESLAGQHDSKRVEDDLVFLDHAGPEYKDVLAEACWRAMLKGDENAAGWLDNLIERERAFLRLEIPDGPAADVLHPPLHAPVIKKVVEMAAQYEMRPTRWLDQAELPGKAGVGHHWELFDRYHRKFLEAYPDDSDVHRNYNAHLTDLMTDEQKFSDHFLVTATADALEYGRGDRAFLDDLLWLFLLKIERVKNASAEHAYLPLIKAGKALMRSTPCGAYDRRPNVVNLMHQHIEEAFAHMPPDNEEYIGELLQWRIMHTAWSGASPGSLASIAGDQVSAFRVKDPQYMRNDLLTTQAWEYSRAGDFASARSVLETVTDPSSLRYGLRTCLKTVQHGTAPELLNDLVVSTNSLELWYCFGRAVCAARGDLDTLERLASGVVPPLPAEDSFLTRKLLKEAVDMCDQLAQSDEARALNTARVVLSQMRGKGMPYTLCQRLSANLIASGDREEAVRAYEAIIGQAEARSFSPSRTLYLLEIMQALEKGHMV